MGSSQGLESWPFERRDVCAVHARVSLQRGPWCSSPWLVPRLPRKAICSQDQGSSNSAPWDPMKSSTAGPRESRAWSRDSREKSLLLPRPPLWAVGSALLQARAWASGLQGWRKGVGLNPRLNLAAWVPILNLLLPSQVTLNKLLNLHVLL